VPSARLFVALELPPRARERIVEWRSRAVGGREDMRLVADRSLHVTLAFLGRRPEAEVDAIGAALEGAAAGLAPGRPAATGVWGLPPRRPRLFALDLEDRRGRAAAVQQSISDALAAGGWYEPERRAFWPHVTLARVRKGARAAAIDEPPPAEPFTASVVTLYRSHLSPRGASYEPLAQVRLRRG
jgi:RNA 2',3'-cyclic 3'-phosphodiesterase